MRDGELSRFNGMRPKLDTLRALVLSATTLWMLPAIYGEELACNLSHYKSLPGLSAAVADNALIVTWTGDTDTELRLRWAIHDGTPTIQDLGVRHKGGQWLTLATNVTPEFRVVTGFRRLPLEQVEPLLDAGVKITPEVVEENKWEAFWDAPLRVPGAASGPNASSVMSWMPAPRFSVGGQPGMPRRSDEINRTTAIYQVHSCEVNTNGARLEVSFPGVKLGVFSGALRYTVYKGANLIRQEVVAKTEEPSVAYKYDAGFKGLPIGSASQVVWRDITNNWQNYDFSAAANEHEFVLRTANRLIAAEVNGGSISAFPPPHTFFWAREFSVNLGYNWYRKDSPSQFAFGVREAESEADPGTAGRGIEDFRECFALKSARPGTWQRMPVYFYITTEPGQAAIKSSLAYTREDHFKPLPGYLVMAAHFHPRIVQQLETYGTGLNTALPDIEALKAAGVNVWAPSDVRGYSGRSSGPSTSDAARDRLANLALYYEIARLHSDKNFWLLPAEELTEGKLMFQLGGHHDVLVSHPVFWNTERIPGQPLVEEDPKYGKVYHIGTPADLMEMVHREDLLIFEPHPRGKASSGYPDAIKDTAHFHDENYRGFGFRWGMGLDGSEQRLCDYRCLPVLDEMNNWIASLPTPPKYLEAISELHGQGPGDDVYANNPVTYVKIGERRPTIDNWRPIIDSLKRGDHFVTSGEVLIPSYAVQGSGNQRTIVANVEWTFPLEFVEVVWGDGQRIDRQMIPATELPPFGQHHYEIPFDATGKKWVRFAAWDSAGNGALVQPVKLSQ